MTIQGTSAVNAGAAAITLTQTNNFTGAVSLNNSGANNVSIADGNGLILGTSGLGTGTLTVNCVGLTQVGAVTQGESAGAVTINAGAGRLPDAGEQLHRAVSLNNQDDNVTVTDGNALILGTSGVGLGRYRERVV
jgi:hypothetical protein